MSVQDRLEEHGSAHARLILAAAIGSLLLGVGAQLFLWADRDGHAVINVPWLTGRLPWVALGLYLLAGLLIVVAWRSSGRTRDPYQPPRTLAARPLSWLDVAPLLASLVASIAAMVLFRGQSSPLLAWALTGLALAGIAWGAWRIASRGGASAQEASSHEGHDKVPTLELAVIVLLVLVATLLRVNQWDLVPSGVFFDEAQNGLDAAQILTTGAHPIWSDSLSGRPTLHLSILAGVFRLLGVRVFSEKWVSIVFGVLGVIGLYKLTRALFGGLPALFAATFLTFSHFDIHYSRLVFEAVMTPFLITMSIFFFWRAVHRGKWWDYALTGVMLAAGLYTYVSFRVLPLALVPVGLYLLISQRGFLRRNLAGFLMAVALLALLLVPLGRFAINNPSRFLNRLNEVSLMSEVKEDGSLRPVRKNLVGYLTMFNWRGDANRVQNLPGEPGLSLFPSVLFALGLALSFYQLRDPRHILVLSWFVVALLPGMLTHSIETPHSTRVIAALPAAALLAGLGLDAIWRAMAGFGGKKGLWPVASASCVGLVVLASGAMDYHIYFVQQATNPNCYFAFEPDANRVGALVEQLAPDYTVLVSPTYRYVFPEDAVTKFVAYNAPDYESIDLVQDIPYKGDADRGVAYILEPAYEAIMPLLRQWYPDGQLLRQRGQFSTTLYSVFLVTRDEVLAARGLEGSYLSTDGAVVTQHDMQAGLTWQPAEAPMSRTTQVTWQGGLYAPAYGTYTFTYEGSGDATLSLNEEEISWGEGVILPKGLHALSLSYTPGKDDSGLRVYWQGPTVDREVVPAEALAAGEVEPHGLEATYYRNANWQGAAASVQLDPLIMANAFLLEGTFSITWRGQVYAPVAGAYKFGTDSDDGSLLYLDGALVVDNGGTHGNLYKEASVSLTQGWHDIRIDYMQNSGGMGLALYWAPPGIPRARLPMSELRYPIGDWGTDIVVEGPMPSTQVAEPTEVQPYSLGALEVKWGKEGSRPGEFKEPRGIAVGLDHRVYVADTGNKRVQAFDANGRFLDQWSGGDVPFELPWDLAVTPAGRILVLDAASNWVFCFDADGSFAYKFGGPEAHLYQPRGMSVDARGNVYVADTGGHRVVMFDPLGTMVGEYGGQGSGPGQMLEPTDFAVAPTGDMFVVDDSNRRIQRWDVSGSYIGEWTIMLANAYNGPHLAVLPDSSLFITVPELHEVWRYSPTGEVLGEWGGPGAFRVPTDLALDGSEYLYIADTLQHQVQKYRIVQAP